MAVLDLLARGIDGIACQVVLLGLVVLDNFDLDVRAEELEALIEIADVITGTFSGF